jgi:hypothetical protein
MARQLQTTDMHQTSSVSSSNTHNDNVPLVALGQVPVQTDRVVDQASRLRQLASPLPRHISRSSLRFADVLKQNPRIVLISEFPVLHSAYGLAWELARQLTVAGGRTAIVDLAPAASRLPDQLRTSHRPPLERELERALAAQQPLWSDAPHGRGLASWEPPAADTVTFIAQPPGAFPAAEQMPRICEQLLRSLDSSSRPTREAAPAWQTLILLSEVQGIPLDAPCWQAADEILCLLPQEKSRSSTRPQSHSQLALAEAALAARLLSRPSMQRRMALWKAEPEWYAWGKRGAGLNALRTPQVGLSGFENWQITCPTVDPRSASSQRRNARLAASLAKELNRIALAQASA